MLPDFDVAMPASLEDALKEISGSKNSSAMFMAGGTDLIVRMKDGELSPQKIVCLDRIQGLDQISENDGIIRIGAAVTFRTIIRSELIREKAPELHLAAKNVASPQIRSQATIAGNIANASPCADSLAPLCVLEAELVLQSLSGARRLPVNNCFRGPKENCFDHGEIITQIEFPVPEQPQNAFYLSVGQRKAMSINKLSVAGRILTDKDGAVRKCRFAYGAVAPTVMRGRGAEEFLLGKKLSPETIANCASIASQEVKPITDIRSTMEYRRNITGVLMKRGLTSLI